MLGTRRLELLTCTVSTSQASRLHSTVESLKIARDVILERELELAAKPANSLSSN
jgi:hypothetical protein